jgi:hypothetical protein
LLLKRPKRSSGIHDVYHNPATNKFAPVPRHSEIADSLSKRQRGAVYEKPATGEGFNGTINREVGLLKRMFSLARAYSLRRVV